MKRLIAAVAATIALACAAPSAAARTTRTIYVENLSAGVSNSAVRDAIPAFQAAINKDFAPIWHTPARLKFIGRSTPPGNAERIVLVDFPDCWACLGYHEYAQGQVRAWVGTGTGDWHITFTHELFEQLVDPYADHDFKLARRVALADGTLYAVEVGDPVEATQFTYVRMSPTHRPIRISDFVTPAWYDSSSLGGWDFTGSTTAPLQILKGGYQILRYPGQDWSTINNFHQVVHGDD